MKRYLSLLALTVLSTSTTSILTYQMTPNINNHLNDTFNFQKMQGADNSINSSVIDNQGNIYSAGADGTVYMATKDSLTFTKKLTGLPSTPIKLLVDSNGNIYAGVNFSYGLWKCAANETQFKLVSGTSGYSIFNLAIDQENNVYFPGFVENWLHTTDKDTIFKYEAKTNKVITTNVEFPGIPSGYKYSTISAFTTTNQGKIYAIDIFGRLYQYESPTNTFHLLKDFNLIDTDVQSMVADNDGNLYFQSINDVYKIEIKTNTLTKLNFNPTQSEYMHYMRTDSKGNIYTLNDETVFKFNFNTNTFENLYTWPQPPKQILQVWDVNFNNQGNIYITITGNGIYKS